MIDMYGDEARITNLSHTQTEVRILRGVNENVTDGISELNTRWDLHLKFTYPATLTEAETREALAGLFAAQARTRCRMIIQQLSDEVVPVILPQLEELAEYEEKVFRLRREQHPPNIEEKWVSLLLTGDR